MSSELATSNNSNSNQILIKDLRLLIDHSKSKVARTANSIMTMTYWSIGKRISQEILKNSRADYGEQVVKNVAHHLSAEYGKGYTRTSIIRMIQFYQSFENEQIGATLSHQLTWSHIVEILPLKEKVQREFYAYFATKDNWSVRQLRTNIHKMTYERTKFVQDSKKPTESLEKLLLSDDSEMPVEMTLKDPYLLSFLNLPDDHNETDLEKAILLEIEKFILELGSGFSFVERQKRMTIDNDHFYLDLLFFNRKLKRLVAIELKNGKFKAEYKGQMELYLSWLKTYESMEGENTPIGIILCTEKSKSQIELLDISSSNIHVAEYWTELPPIEVFERKIQEIVLNAQNRIDNHRIDNNQND